MGGSFGNKLVGMYGTALVSALLPAAPSTTGLTRGRHGLRPAARPVAPRHATSMSAARATAEATWGPASLDST